MKMTFWLSFLVSTSLCNCNVCLSVFRSFLALALSVVICMLIYACAGKWASHVAFGLLMTNSFHRPVSSYSLNEFGWTEVYGASFYCPITSFIS